MKIMIMLYVLIVVALIGQSEPQRTNFDSNNFTIDNCVNEIDFESIVQKEHAWQYWFVDKDFIDGRTLKLSVVKPHSKTHKPHFHEEDEFFFVFEGEAEFHLNGKTKIVNKYATFYCPPNSVHGIRNIGDTELKYLVIKTLE